MKRHNKIITLFKIRMKYVMDINRVATFTCTFILHNRTSLMKAHCTAVTCSEPGPMQGQSQGPVCLQSPLTSVNVSTAFCKNACDHHV